MGRWHGSAFPLPPHRSHVRLCACSPTRRAMFHVEHRPMFHVEQWDPQEGGVLRCPQQPQQPAARRGRRDQ
jgi:hypothetical protein